MAMTDATTTTGAAGITSSYDLTKKISLDMGFPVSTARFVGKISLISIYCTNVSTEPKPSSLTIKITRDSGGDECILTSTAGQMETGLTTATKSTAVYMLDGVVSMAEGDVVYLFGKTNIGTLDISEVRITWLMDD